MEGIRVLFVSQEITPFLPETQISIISRYLPQKVQERGMEIRTFMPRFGCINERRNQLHEVIRLSGMNIIINDFDHPLIIKVASIQSARMQVYFIDNEDYFHRKAIFYDNDGNFFDDNDERAMFFARGVFETVKKLQWPPDIIHCHGWFTYMIPIYLKKIYHDDPLFSEAKVIISVYNDEFSGILNPGLINKLEEEGINKQQLTLLANPTYLNLTKTAIENSDGVIIGSKEVNQEIIKFLEKSKKNYLPYVPGDNYVDNYIEFYDKILSHALNKS